MDFLIEISPILAVVFYIVALILLLRVLAYNHTFSKYFSNRKFNTKTVYELNIKEQKEVFKLFIHNNNINEVRVIAFGFHYNNKTIDYFPLYLEQQQILKTHKFIIPSRDFIEYQIEASDLYQIIKNGSSKPYKVSNIYTYVSDSMGIVTKTKAKQVRKILQAMVDKQKQVDKNAQAAILKQQKEEKKQLQKERRAIFKNKQKERMLALKSKLQILFKRK